LHLTEGSEFQATQMKNWKINQNKTKEQFDWQWWLCTCSDLQQQLVWYWQPIITSALTSSVAMDGCSCQTSALSTQRNFLTVFRGHLISANIPPRKQEVYYTFSLRVEWKLCILVGIGSLQLSRNTQMNLPILHLVIYIFLGLW